MKRLNIIGKRFGKLYVIKDVGTSGNGCSLFKCRCDCGVEKIIIGGSLTKKNGTKSCGCLIRERTIEIKTTHGKTKTPEYRAWAAFLNRCYNKNNKNYDRYGKKGIKVCDRWKDSFLNFLEDMGNRPSSKHTVDRKNPYGDYTPENCRWATLLQQSHNQRVHLTSTTGFAGVYYVKKKDHYHVAIALKGKRIFIGLFKTLIEAVAARKNAEIKFWHIPDNKEANYGQL